MPPDGHDWWNWNTGLYISSASTHTFTVTTTSNANISWPPKERDPAIVGWNGKRLHVSHCTDEELAKVWEWRRSLTWKQRMEVQKELARRRLSLPGWERHPKPYYDDDNLGWHDDPDEGWDDDDEEDF